MEAPSLGQGGRTVWTDGLDRSQPDGMTVLSPETAERVKDLPKVT